MASINFLKPITRATAPAARAAYAATVPRTATVSLPKEAVSASVTDFSAVEAIILFFSCADFSLLYRIAALSDAVFFLSNAKEAIKPRRLFFCKAICSFSSMLRIFIVVALLRSASACLLVNPISNPAETNNLSIITLPSFNAPTIAIIRAAVPPTGILSVVSKSLFITSISLVNASTITLISLSSAIPIKKVSQLFFN